MLVRNPSTGMSSQRVHVYIELLVPRDPLCCPCLADLTLTLGEGSANSQAPITEPRESSSTGVQRYKAHRSTVSRRR